MAQINKSSEYFNTLLYTGDGATSTAGTTARTLTGVGFQPDWVWVKERSNTEQHFLQDAVRGASKVLASNTTSAEADVLTDYTDGGINGFVSDGFTLGSGTAGNANNINTNTETYVAWNWLANGGTTSSNTDGDVTSTVQVNSTAGFSITTYTGNSSSPLYVGHGLGVAPKVVLAKHRNVSTHWRMWHQGLSGAGYYLILDLTNAQSNSEPIFWQIPSSTTVGFLSDFSNTSHDVVFYSFAEIKGFSKFGSYTGNGSTDGTFVYTGFKPAWILFKQIQNIGGWTMKDNKRSPENPADERLLADDTPAESTGADIDFLSNGFKCRSASNAVNDSENYIYMAFAENPLVGTNGIPATAR